MVEKQLWELCFVYTLWPIEEQEGVVRKEGSFPDEMKGMCVETRQVRVDAARAGLQLPQNVNDCLAVKPVVFTYLSNIGKEGMVWRGQTAGGGREGRPLVEVAQPFPCCPKEFSSIFNLAHQLSKPEPCFNQTLPHTP